MFAYSFFRHVFSAFTTDISFHHKIFRIMKKDFMKFDDFKLEKPELVKGGDDIIIIDENVA